MNTSERKYLPHILILAVVGLGAFMDGLDGAIVNVALPYIAGNFHAEMGVASLVITVYLVALSGLMIIFGKVLSIAGIKRSTSPELPYLPLLHFSVPFHGTSHPSSFSG